jgi:hypothetical protein
LPWALTLRDASGIRKASPATITAILERVFIRSITSVELDQPLQGKDGVKPYVGVKHGGGEFVAGFEGKVGKEGNGRRGARKNMAGERGWAGVEGQLHKNVQVVDTCIETCK